VELLLNLWTVLSQGLLMWVKAHPMTAWALLLAEGIDSAVASKLEMPKETSSAAYKTVFILTHALAINQERVKAALAILRGNGIGKPAPPTART